MEQGYASRVDETIRKGREADFLRFESGQRSGKRRKLTPDYALGCKRNINSDTFFAVARPAERRYRHRPHRPDRSNGHQHGRWNALRRRHDRVRNRLLTGQVPSTMKVSGLGGQALTDVRQDGPEAYLGMTVAGFPNFFMIYGPNTNALTSIVFHDRAVTRSSPSAFADSSGRRALAAAACRRPGTLQRRRAAHDEPHRLGERLPQLRPNRNGQGRDPVAQTLSGLPRPHRPSQLERLRPHHARLARDNRWGLLGEDGDEVVGDRGEADFHAAEHALEALDAREAMTLER